MIRSRGCEAGSFPPLDMPSPVSSFRPVSGGVPYGWAAADKKMGLFLTILSLNSAANAAELLPLVVRQRR